MRFNRRLSLPWLFLNTTLRDTVFQPGMEADQTKQEPFLKDKLGSEADEFGGRSDTRARKKLERTSVGLPQMIAHGQVYLYL
jgi:hypothetical protein